MTRPIRVRFVEAGERGDDVLGEAALLGLRSDLVLDATTPRLAGQLPILLELATKHATFTRKPPVILQVRQTTSWQGSERTGRS